MKELKGFVKVALKPGEEKDVTITIGKEELSYFNDVNHEWVAEPGKFEALISRKNEKCNKNNGVYVRYKYPVLTAEHAPLIWRYDFDEKTNPYICRLRQLMV